MRRISHIIDGEAVSPLGGATFVTTDPWTRQAWAEVSLADSAIVDSAIAAARRASDDGPWPRMGTQARGKVLHRLADLIEEHAVELATADSEDMGKPIAEALKRDVPRAAANFRFFADHARLVTSDCLPMDSSHHVYTRFEPCGVVAAIAPWNFPLMLETWKIAPALAWGNTVVLKPAEESPASAMRLGLLALEAGLPPGVLNVVQGFGTASAGEMLVNDPRVDRITFTGESATGRTIAAAAAKNLTPVSLELGGKGANLVFADANLENAVSWSLEATFTNAGQVCLAGSRLFVQSAVYDEFIARFVRAAEALVIGDPKHQDTQIGPLSSEKHYAKVRRYLEDALDDGAKLETGGLGDGWTIRPTVLTNVGLDKAICREEVFGPIVTLHSFDSEEEGIKLANSTPYGLNAMLFTENLSRAHRVSAALRAGTVWTNCFFIRDLRAPFGGVGDSGVGREGGSFSREFFTEPKAVVMAISPDA